MGELLLFFLFVAGVFWMSRGTKKKTYYGQTLGDVPSTYKAQKPVLVSDTEPSDAPKQLSFGKRLYGIVFLTVWLSIWSVGCYVALRTRLGLTYGDEGYIFLTIWLAFGIPAWFMAAWTLFRLLRGDYVEFDNDPRD